MPSLAQRVACGECVLQRGRAAGGGCNALALQLRNTVTVEIASGARCQCSLSAAQRQLAAPGRIAQDVRSAGEASASSTASEAILGQPVGICLRERHLERHQQAAAAAAARAAGAAASALTPAGRGPGGSRRRGRFRELGAPELAAQRRHVHVQRAGQRGVVAVPDVQQQALAVDWQPGARASTASRSNSFGVSATARPATETVRAAKSIDRSPTTTGGAAAPPGRVASPPRRGPGARRARRA